MRHAPGVVGMPRVLEAPERLPGTLVCGILIFAVKGLLLARGFGATLKLIKDRTASIPCQRCVSRDCIREVERRVALAAALYPGRARCLEQSLLLYYLLRRAGIRAELRMGVQPYPFLAHTWVEWFGEPMNDIPEHVDRFALIPLDDS